MKDEKENTGFNDTLEIPKANAHIIVEIVEYMANAVVSKTIIRKTTGNITAMSFDEGEELGEKKVAFDTYVQVIDGTAQITIDNKKHHLQLGQGIVIPAHSSHCFNANQQFKMISTVIKSGYDS